MSSVIVPLWPTVCMHLSELNIGSSFVISSTLRHMFIYLLIYGGEEWDVAALVEVWRFDSFLWPPQHLDDIELLRNVSNGGDLLSSQCHLVLDIEKYDNKCQENVMNKRSYLGYPSP